MKGCGMTKVTGCWRTKVKSWRRRRRKLTLRGDRTGVEAEVGEGGVGVGEDGGVQDGRRLGGRGFAPELGVSVMGRVVGEVLRVRGAGMVRWFGRPG